MAATSLPDFLDHLVDALRSRSRLSGVNIFSCPVSPEDLGLEGIEFAEEVTVEQTLAAMGSTVIAETYSVPGSLLVAASTSKLGINASAKAARDRCAAILAEIVAELGSNDTMTASVQDVQIASQNWHQGMRPDPPARVVWVEFSLAVKARVTP